MGTEGHCKLESYDFGAERKRLKSPDRCLFNRAIASYERLPSVTFVERRRGQVPLNFDEGRDQREEVCDEGVGLWGESQVSNDFPKIVDKIPDDRGWNRGKPGVNSVTLQRGRQRVFEDLLAVLEVSPVRWE